MLRVGITTLDSKRTTRGLPTRFPGRVSIDGTLSHPAVVARLRSSWCLDCVSERQYRPQSDEETTSGTVVIISDSKILVKLGVNSDGE